MRAVQIHEHGGPEVLKLVELPDPTPGPGEVLAKVLAVSVNHLDLWVRRGMPGMPLPLPMIPGCDGTGEVVEVGEGVTRFAVGDKVILEPGYSSGSSAHDEAGNDHLSADYRIRGEHSDGLDCELVVFPERLLTPLPEGVDPVAAAAVPLVFLTAWGMVVSRAALQEGETVLVLGGASGVGSAAIQIAKDLGARVVATAGSDEKLALVQELGADAAVDHRDEAWPKAVKSALDGGACDVVVEHVGPATWEGSMRCLARNGRLVTCGGTTGPTVSLLLPHLFIKNISVLGSTMGPRSALAPIFERVSSGAYRPVLDRSMPLSEVRAAHELLEGRQVNGKLVLIPGS
ncbi:MAG: zinc-binding dehydrogenase [Planctomycetes bacterium]|nr:zinc-binding dehydrogenase [Planctomycetota bacterium]